ncbi:MAG: S53 family serine peptidase [Terracidiphilus sp.]|jgi:subtilase family serine protease
MRNHSLATGVVLCALTALSLSLSNSAATASRVQALGPADQDAVTHFSVYLPLTHQDVLEQLLRDQTDSTSPSYHQWLTPAQFKVRFGPSASDVAKVRSALLAAGFTIVGEQTQNLEVEGPVRAVEEMFATRLQRVQTPQGRIKFAAAERHLTLPDTLASVGAVIPEFTTHLMAHVHSARMGQSLLAADPLFRLSSSDSFFYPNDLNEAYQLPSFRTEIAPFGTRRPAQIAGVGSHIGIVISSVINPSDLDDTFNSTLDLGGGNLLIQAYSANSNLPVPSVTIRAVNGGSGAFDPTSDDGAEASLDTQISLGTAPGAKETLYDIPELSDDSITAGYTAVDEDNAVDVVSSSFGECELDFTPAYNGGVDFTSILRTFHALFQQGNAQGITFVASSGDNGGVPCVSAAFSNNPTDGTSFVAGVENPASDPNVTGVGGTNLSTTATPGVDDATYATENANFDPRVPAEFQISATTTVTVNNNTWGSGGGFSTIFSKPFYQFLVNTGSNRQRSVPDVSLMMGGCPGDADLTAQNCLLLPRSAAIVWIGGEPDLVIGTSSSSPEIAGVLALAVELNGGRLGNVNPLIYTLSAVQTLAGGTKAPKALQYFHREITGNNNFFTVNPGQAYSEVLGNSTLDVKNFLGLPFVAPAGTPNTPSNP